MPDTAATRQGIVRALPHAGHLHTRTDPNHGRIYSLHGREPKTPGRFGMRSSQRGGKTKVSKPGHGWRGGVCVCERKVVDLRRRPPNIVLGEETQGETGLYCFTSIPIQAASRTSLRGRATESERTRKGRELCADDRDESTWWVSTRPGSETQTSCPRGSSRLGIEGWRAERGSSRNESVLALSRPGSEGAGGRLSAENTLSLV
jgi:hypothetical protein